MYQTIVNAMQALADAGAIFGLENPRKGESQFQMALGAKLQDMTGSDGWSWSYGDKEEQFHTTVLSNETRIKVDLVGRHDDKGMVAIELKYVRVSPRRRAPSNPPGFPYDVAKDCLRLDLLRTDHCKPAGKPIPDNLQTYEIGMTNWPDYWLDGKPKRGWATNFYKAIRSTPVRFDSVIRTEGKNSLNTIALGRCHIAFGQPWTGEWKSYGDHFRYLILRPESEAKPEWSHHRQLATDEQSAVFPFLHDDSREGWRRRASTAGHRTPR